MPNLHDDIYAQIVASKGENSQFLKAIEELSELSRAIARYLAGSKQDRANLIDEMADVRIMLGQLIHMIGPEAEAQFKIKRDLVKTRLEDGTL